MLLGSTRRWTDGLHQANLESLRASDDTVSQIELRGHAWPYRISKRLSKQPSRVRNLRAAAHLEGGGHVSNHIIREETDCQARPSHGTMNRTDYWRAERSKPHEAVEQIHRRSCGDGQRCWVPRLSVVVTTGAKVIAHSLQRHSLGCHLLLGR